MPSSEIFSEEFVNEILKSKAQDLKEKKANLDREQAGIKHHEIAELQKPIESLIKQIGYDLDSGKYGLIIGEDASGRIPALIMKKVIDHIYKKNGHPIPPMRFIAGFEDDFSEGIDPKHYNESEMNQLSRKIKVIQQNLEEFKGKDALLITDYIYTGNSTRSIKKTLNDVGIGLEIATISGPHEYGTTFSGSENNSGSEPKIYRQYDIGGVIKDRYEPYASTYESDLQDARDDVKKIADRIIEKYDNFEL